jgi:hypothetical protein
MRYDRERTGPEFTKPSPAQNTWECILGIIVASQVSRKKKRWFFSINDIQKTM